MLQPSASWFIIMGHSVPSLRVCQAGPIRSAHGDASAFHLACYGLFATPKASLSGWYLSLQSVQNVHSLILDNYKYKDMKFTNRKWIVPFPHLLTLVVTFYSRWELAPGVRIKS